MLVVGAQLIISISMKFYILTAMAAIIIGIMFSLYSQFILVLYFLPILLFIGITSLIFSVISLVAKSKQWKTPLIILLFISLTLLSAYLTGLLIY
jgi:hypothetical protein